MKVESLRPRDFKVKVQKADGTGDLKSKFKTRYFNSHKIVQWFIRSVLSTDSKSIAPHLNTQKFDTAFNLKSRDPGIFDRWE